MAAAAARCIDSDQPLVVSELILAETAYVLTSVYEIPRAAAVDALVADLKRLGLWTEAMRNAIKRAEGSIQAVDGIPAELKQLYRTAWELPQRALIDLAVARGPYVDQSQSLNLFMETPTIGKLSSMYLHAWKAGLKTTYYLRSLGAAEIIGREEYLSHLDGLVFGANPREGYTIDKVRYLVEHGGHVHVGSAGNNN